MAIPAEAGNARIRPIEERDAAAWTRLRRLLWPDDVDADAEARAFFEGPGASLTAAAFIAIDESETPLGFVELSLRNYSDGCTSTPVPHVEGWYVVEEARGRGIGRGLMSAAEQWARVQGYTELASDTELHNNAALRAHIRAGFEEVERLIKLRKSL